MVIQVCDVCGNMDEPIEYKCSLCKSDLCCMPECASYLKKHGYTCTPCMEELPLEDFTEEEIKEYNIT